MKVQLKENDFNFENGKEKLWWAENAVGHIIYPTTPLSPLPAGFMRCSTTKPREMDRVFDRLLAQTREDNEHYLERLYNQGRERYLIVRACLRTRLHTAGVSEAEKAFIRASLERMDAKELEMQRNTINGRSAMQESERPIEGARTRVN